MGCGRCGWGVVEKDDGTMTMVLHEFFVSARYIH